MVPNSIVRQAGRAFPIIVVLIALAAMAAGIWFSARFSQAQPPQLQSGSLLQPPKALPSFTLHDQHGREVTPQRLQGQWTLVFFGYTHCPDVCPNTLAVLNLTIQALPPQLREHTQVLFVSVDPQRDTREQLAHYMSFFNPAFIGARGAEADLSALTRATGILYSSHKPDQHGDYAVDHSAAVLVLDPKARWTALFSKLPHKPDEMASDLTAIQDYYEEQS